MTSQLNVDTIADKAGTGPVGLTKQNAAKAFVSVEGTSGPSIFQSLNISSITDNSVGNNSFGVTSAISGVDYALVSGSNASGASNYAVARVATSFKLIQRLDGDGSTASDTNNSAHLNGDLA